MMGSSLTSELALNESSALLPPTTDRGKRRVDAVQFPPSLLVLLVQTVGGGDHADGF
jgi:hypothetical protein